MQQQQLNLGLDLRQMASPEELLSSTSSVPTTETPNKKTEMLVNLIGGAIGGFSVVLVGYPFDLLKVRMQTALEAKGLHHIRPHLLPMMRDIWRGSGFRGFYQGASAPFLAVSPIFAINFYGYGLGKQLYDYFWPPSPFKGSEGKEAKPPIRKFAFGALFTALQTAAVVIPAERIKVCMQLPRSQSSEMARLNAVQVGVRLLKDGGIQNLYRGATTTLTRDIPGLTVFFTSYEWFKRQFSVDKPEMVASVNGMLKVMAAGGFAGMTSWMISLPSDTIKSRLQAAPKDSPLLVGRYPSWNVTVDLVKNDGFLALYRGITPVMLRAFPANAACFLGFEMTKVIFNKAMG